MGVRRKRERDRGRGEGKRESLKGKEYEARKEESGRN